MERAAAQSARDGRGRGDEGRGHGPAQEEGVEEDDYKAHVCGRGIYAQAAQIREVHQAER